MRPQFRAGICATVAALTVLMSSLPAPAAAGPDDVRSAKAQVAAMQARVESVAARLSAGARAYQAGERHLAAVQRRQRATEREARQLSLAAAEEQRRLNAIAAAAYRRPLPSGLSLAFTTDRTGFAGALSAKADLEHVSGSQQDVLRAVVARRLRLDHLARTAEQLSADARRTERSLARQLADLRAIADNANAELQKASARLERATAAERARLDRLRAARASRARGLGGGPMCTGESTDGYANGFMPMSALCPLWGAPGHMLRADAAAAFNQLSRLHAATVGRPLCVTDSYRTYGEQVSVYRRKPGLAAAPGTSEHGWGKAVDFCGGVERFGSHAFEWMKRNAGRFGFFHPAWAEPSGSRPEAWHWEFSG